MYIFCVNVRVPVQRSLGMRSNVVNISNESRSRVHQPLVGGSIIYTLLLGLIEFDSSLILSDMQFWLLVLPGYFV